MAKIFPSTFTETDYAASALIPQDSTPVAQLQVRELAATGVGGEARQAASVNVGEPQR